MTTLAALEAGAGPLAPCVLAARRNGCAVHLAVTAWDRIADAHAVLDRLAGEGCLDHLAAPLLAA